MISHKGLTPQTSMVLENNVKENESETEAVSQSEEDQIKEDLALREVLVAEKSALNRQVEEITTRLKEVIPATDNMEDGYHIDHWKVTNIGVSRTSMISNRESFVTTVTPLFLSINDISEEEAAVLADEVWRSVRRVTTSQTFRQFRLPPSTD